MKTTAALLVVVVIVGAVIVVPVPTLSEPGVISKTEVSTPEKAIMEPTAEDVPVPRVKVNDDPSEPSALLYNIVLLRGAPVLCNAPSINVHPDSEAFVVVFPVCVMLTIMTSPLTTPAGLLIVKVELVVVALVAVPRCVI
jgi:hypothetical protein